MSCRDMVRGVQDEFGKLDILVNNVGIQFVSPVQDFPEDKWDAIMDICLNSTFHATKAALPAMLEQGWGRIINTGSMHALVASPYKSAYNAAKHGVVSLWLDLSKGILREHDIMPASPRGQDWSMCRLASQKQWD